MNNSKALFILLTKCMKTKMYWLILYKANKRNEQLTNVTNFILIRETFFAVYGHQSINISKSIIYFIMSLEELFNVSNINSV